MSQMVENIDECEAVMDDIVVLGKDQTEHDQRLNKVMDKAKLCGLKFNKVQISKKTRSATSDTFCQGEVSKLTQRKSEQFKT